MELLFYIFLSLFLIYILRVQIQNQLTFNFIPDAPLIPQGTFQSILFNNPRDQAMEKCVEQVPDSVDVGFFATQLFFSPTIFITDGSLARFVMVDPKQFPKASLNKIFSFIFETGVFFSNGMTWSLHRRMLQSAFSQSSFGDIIVDAFNELEGVWNEQIERDGGISTVSVFEWADRTVFQTMGRFSFNENVNSIARFNCNLYDIYVKMMKMLVRPTILLHLLKLDPETVKHLPYYSEFYALIKRLRSEFLSIIQKRRAKLAKMTDFNQKNQRDILARILLSAEQKLEYTDDAIVDDMISLFAAGHETVAITIAYTQYFLAKYPAYQKMVHKEAKAFYERYGDSVASMSQSDIEMSLPILRRVILEVWRLMPPAAGTLARIVDSDNVWLNGLKIPKGTRVLISIYNAHRCEKTWGPDAAEFIPERFCVVRKLENRLNDLPDKLLTFGYGPRSCLGSPFGTVEGMLGISKLASKFWFEIPTDSPNEKRIIAKPVLAVLAPVDLQLRIQKK